MEKAEEIYMQRALNLARRGIDKVSPNPMVGCVIVHNGVVIGEGWHQKYGAAHAEVNAIGTVANHDILPESTMYVTLEPCSHFGKTPPCADLIIQKKLGRVVIAHQDPNPLVRGKGIARLKDAGILVEVGLLEKDAKDLNIRFLTYIERQRPFVVLKWAESADGFIARKNYDSKWISNWLSRKLVHKMRAENDAVLVGRKTAFYDNPRLNVRDWHGTDPLRVVIDSQKSLPVDLNLFNGEQPTLCYNLIADEQSGNNTWVKLDSNGPMIPQLLQNLYQRKIQSVLVEGGSLVLQYFLAAGLWDEMHIFRSKTSFGTGITSPRPQGNLVFEEHLLGDWHGVFRNPMPI